MKVILTNNVKTLGSIGEIVNVSAGHARNFLFPNNLAILADDSNKKQMEDYQKMLSKKVEEEKKAASEVAKKINALSLTLEKRIGGSGKLFGTVTTQEIANLLADKGIEVERRLILVDNIKGLGSYDVKIKLFKGVEATLKLKVEMDAKQVQEMKEKQANPSKKASKAKKAAEGSENPEAVTETTEA